MNPSAFTWEGAAASLAVVSVLAVLLERALALLFENKWFLKAFNGRGLTDLMAAAAAWFVCHGYDVDAVAWLLGRKESTHMGIFVTALTVAGGSKGMVHLWHEVADVRSAALRATQDAPKEDA